MEKFIEIVEAPAGSRFILQGNAAFALGVVHAGYHAADGYPGTPSTEVIDKSLKYVQDRIVVGWSVNEAVAVGVAVGHSIAGFDAVVTMKIPGVFQAGDAITTSAFYSGGAGALVIFAATDYVPSSTQHVIDARYFFASARIPVLEPRDHQEMYEVAGHAADISRKFNTPVVVLASGILTHSEGLVETKPPRTVVPRGLPEEMNAWMLLPVFARANYNKATQDRIPAVRKYAETSPLVKVETGTENWGIIVTGESTIIVKEALAVINRNPHLLLLGVSYPVPESCIRKFAGDIDGQLFIIEDGDRFMEEKIRLMGIDITGKEENSIITDWSPEAVISFLKKHIAIDFSYTRPDLKIKSLARPPSICPGCPYRVFGLTLEKYKKQKKIFASFGDIGCSTLLYFMKAIDTVLCMGASDSVRQGFILSRPDMAHRTVSVIGDSCECHSGLDATRNAIFRNTPGVKVILDNRITAMTGGQPAPSSAVNLAGMHHNFNLKRAVEAEGGRMVVVSSYNLKEVDKAVKESLELAEKGIFTTLILEGGCIQEADSKLKSRQLEFDHEKCKRCGRCGICPGIEHDENLVPRFTNLCTNCGGNMQVCMQRCPSGAIVERKKEKDKMPLPKLPVMQGIKMPIIDKNLLPESLRVAVRGIGGQGNLFFGKVLSEVALRTPYARMHIVKGDTHGMAQLGGPVISTFSCGNVYSPVLAPNSADVLVVMEISEILRPGFLELLKPGGTIIFNNFSALPVTAKREEYPALADIEESISGYKAIKIDAVRTAATLGDIAGRTANVVVLGLLSTIEPFSAIPEEVWLDALMSVSPGNMVKSANKLAFEAGRGLKQ
ncbi:MAG: 2-oxoacid:acceptor oxidoreductase family protein [Bacteroidetes bacterium]|nr:2-oxoacid:acceptor oxidoreductase family protein [Bacteroidota bacterium]